MSGDRYYIKDQNALYFLTFTIVDWIDIFSRREHKIVITDSLNYCIENKGLVVYAWVLMSNHMHIVAKADDGFKMSDIVRDFKKHTAKTIIKQIENETESRRNWILDRLAFAGKKLNRIKKYKFWQDSNHAIELTNNEMIDQKINYIHENPVRSLIVAEPEHYLFGSAVDYSGMKGYVKIESIGVLS